MSVQTGLLAIIPARGGSKGIPGKNLRLIAGLPLIAHTILCAKRCAHVQRLIVSTDSREIAERAAAYGAEVPFLRPAELARDETPMWPVVRHALGAVETSLGTRFEYVLLLDPTTMGRLPEDIAAAFDRLMAKPDADGIIGVSRPEFNPIWHCVTEQDGWMHDLIPEGRAYGRRQDLPAVYRINASLYIWRAAFVRREEEGWRHGRMLLFEIPEWRAVHIDGSHDLQRAEILVRSGFIRLPWLANQGD